MRRCLRMGAMFAAGCALMTGMAQAGHIELLVKWSQPPDTVTSDDMLSLHVGGTDARNFIVHDDWQCDSPQPVYALRWWGSYLDPENNEYAPRGARMVPFEITWHEDVPADGEPSHPGKILRWLFIDAQERPAFVDGGGVQVYEYNAYLGTELHQEVGKIYWFGVALDPHDDRWIPDSDEVPAWGWSRTTTEQTLDKAISNDGRHFAPWFETETENDSQIWDRAFEVMVDHRIKMHYPQRPDPSGWDVNATANATPPRVVADDWLCTADGLVSNMCFWGSWRDGKVGELESFHLSIHADIPDPDGGGPLHSMPGELLWQWDTSDFTVGRIDPYAKPNEGWYDPLLLDIRRNNHEEYYLYCITNIPSPYDQVHDTIYWLDISATVADPVATQWGWKTTVDPWNDNAVWFDAPVCVDMFGPTEADVDEFAVNSADLIPENSPVDDWYYYEDSDWWNVWFYDHPLDFDHWKVVHIEFDVDDAQPGANLVFAVNWSLPKWSQVGNPPDDPRIPPLPENIPNVCMGDYETTCTTEQDCESAGVPGPCGLEDRYIGREILWEGAVTTGLHFVFDWVLPWNPEWISVDVRGEGFTISGSISHRCIPGDSLNQAFVIGQQVGACCDASGLVATCVDALTEEECNDLLGTGTWLGGGTTCSDDCPLHFPLCDETAMNAGCWAGCLPKACDADCDAMPAALELEEETNFSSKHFLPLVQAGSKINRFQDAVQEALDKLAWPHTGAVEINNVQDVIRAVQTDYVAQGEPPEGINVVIFGHGKPGHIKVGEDVLEQKTKEGQAAQEKLVNALAGKIKMLYLYGCKVGEGKQGQAFIKQLSKELRCPIHTWTGKVYAFPNIWPNGTEVDPVLANKFFVEGEKKDVDIPAVTEWGLVVMALLVLAAGTVVIKRARAMRV